MAKYGAIWPPSSGSLQRTMNRLVLFCNEPRRTPRSPSSLWILSSNQRYASRRAGPKMPYMMITHARIQATPWPPFDTASSCTQQAPSASCPRCFHRRLPRVRRGRECGARRLESHGHREGHIRILRDVTDQLLDVANLEGRNLLDIAQVLDNQLRPPLEVCGQALPRRNGSASLHAHTATGTRAVATTAPSLSPHHPTRRTGDRGRPSLECVCASPMASRPAREAAHGCHGGLPTRAHYTISDPRHRPTILTLLPAAFTSSFVSASLMACPEVTVRSAAP